jgi:hypothetical protein
MLLSKQEIEKIRNRLIAKYPEIKTIPEEIFETICNESTETFRIKDLTTRKSISSNCTIHGLPR